jgi:shikimate 5-dehydrogenase
VLASLAEAGSVQAPLEAHEMAELPEVLTQGADLFVNTTSLGMGGDGGSGHRFYRRWQTRMRWSPISSMFRSITPILAMASARRDLIEQSTGLGMLLYQAVPGLRNLVRRKAVRDSGPEAGW